MFGVLLLIHLIAASIWTGGHIILSLIILPRVLKERSPERLLDFEQKYEKLGMPALILQVITGFSMMHMMLPDMSKWFQGGNPLSHLIIGKVILLGLTIAFALDAKLRVLPNLTEDKLVDMACHIIPVTIFSILFVVLGVGFRSGWL